MLRCCIIFSLVKKTNILGLKWGVSVSEPLQEFQNLEVFLSKIGESVSKRFKFPGWLAVAISRGQEQEQWN